jgi:hypothetical protein
MAEFKENTLVLDHRYDERSSRHYLNDSVSVLHCHHYSTLYTQLALDAKETVLLAETAKNTFYNVLKRYYDQHRVTGIAERIHLASQYFAAVGLGKMEVVFAGEFSGQVTLLRSHVDEGWLKKWGKFDKPVNYIGAGFIGAMFAAVFDVSTGTFNVTERESIAMGAKQSVFFVEKK